MAGFNIVVPASVSPTPGATANVGATQNSITRQFAATGTAPTSGEADQCMIQSSNDNFVSDISNLVLLNAGDPPKPVVTIAQYYRAIRTIVASGSTGMNVNMADEVPTSGAGALAIVNGGQAGPLVIGTTNATSMTFIANNITEAVLNSSGSSTWGSAIGAASTTVQSGTGGITVASTGIGGTTIAAGSGGLGLGVTAPGSSGTEMDACAAGGPVRIGRNFAGPIAIGSALSANLTNITVTTVTGNGGNVVVTGDGGIQLLTGANGGVTVTAGTAQGVAITSGTTGVVTLNSGTTGDVNIGTGAGGADTNAKTVRVATGSVGAKTVIIGATSSTSSFQVLVGTGALDLSGGATDHTTTAGSVTGVSATTVQGGTGGSTVKATGAGNVTLTPGATGNVQLNAAAAATCGVQLGIPVAVPDAAGGGTIGSAATTVDIASVIEVNQTTGAQARTVPSPTITTQARILILVNIGSVSFTVLGKTLAANAANSLSTAVLTWSPGASKWFATA